jgi:hypothetical protein
MAGPHVQAPDQLPVPMSQAMNPQVQEWDQKTTAPRRWSSFRMARNTFSICLLALVSALVLASILELIFLRLSIGEYQLWPEYYLSNDPDNDWRFATSASVDNLQTGSACTALVLASIYGAIAVYSFKKGPIKVNNNMTYIILRRTKPRYRLFTGSA